MPKIIFVVYAHGLGGENLSTRISQADECETLKSNTTEQGRTMIQNDFFGKFFIDCPINVDGQLLQGPQYTERIKKHYQPKIEKYTKTIVVPCHYEVKKIQPHFPNSKFVIIDPPSDLDEQQKLVDGLYEKVWKCVLTNPLEVLGEIISLRGVLNSNANIQEVHNKTKGKPTAVGELHCLIRGIEPTEKNQRNIFTETWQNILLQPKDEIDSNDVLRLPYSIAKQITGEEVIKKLYEPQAI
jgi:hypothetical protein